MAEGRIAIRVAADHLPLRVRSLLDAETPRPPESRYRVRRTHLAWPAAASFTGLAIVGVVAIRAAISSTADHRVVYGSLAAISLLAAALCLPALLRGIAERRAVGAGSYRQGLHLLGPEGLLIAGREVHTWVPRGSMPAGVDVTPPGGGPQIPVYAYDLRADGRSERLECGPATHIALRLWAERGVLPDGGGWV